MSRARPGVKVIIVADGEVDLVALRTVACPEDGPAPLVIGADGGALRAEAADVVPDLVIGDGDSVSAEDLDRLRDLGAAIRLVAAAKDESDTELCVREALLREAEQIVIFGALGGPRPEHALANIALLALPGLEGRDVSIEHARSTIRLLGRRAGAARIEFRASPSDYLSLQSLAPGADGVTTEGLRYPLAGASLPHGPSRGLSNEFIATSAAVSVARGRLLVTLTRRAPDR